MIAIVNVSPDGVPMTGIHQYQVRINHSVIYLNDEWCAGDNCGVQTLIEYNQKNVLERLRETVPFE